MPLWRVLWEFTQKSSAEILCKFCLTNGDKSDIITELSKESEMNNLIQSGGGNRPCEARQPESNPVLNPTTAMSADEVWTRFGPL